MCRRHNLNENQRSQWKRHLLENAAALFETTDKRSSNDEKCIAHLKKSFCHSVPEGHPSDQGVQSLSNAYVTTLEAHGVEVSIARRGRPWENGYAERLIRTLKEEEVHTNDYQSITEARESIGHFIEQVYHQKRPHSALGYLTPMEFQRKTLS